MFRVIDWLPRPGVVCVGGFAPPTFAAPHQDPVMEMVPDYHSHNGGGAVVK